MAISYVGGATGSSAGGATVSVSLTGLTGGSNSAPSDGDLVIHAIAIGDVDNVDGDLTMNTAGYTEVADLFADATQEINLGVFYKFMTATPDTTSVSNNPLGNDAGCAAVVHVFRGVKTVANGGPFDVAAVTAQNAGGNHPDPPSIDTTGTAGIWTVIAGGTGHAAGGATTYTFPANYTTNARSIAGDDTTDATCGMGYRTNPGDPENPGVMTHSAAGTAWAAVTMALSEAAAAVESAQFHVSYRSIYPGPTTN